MDFLMNLWKEEDGQGLAEYGLILALVALVVIGALILFGEQLVALFEEITDTLENKGK